MTRELVQAYAILGNVMSLVGGFASISCSLLMPSLFFLILFWKELGRLQRTGVCCSLLPVCKAEASHELLFILWRCLCFELMHKILFCLCRCLSAVDSRNSAAGAHCRPEHNGYSSESWS